MLHCICIFSIFFFCFSTLNFPSLKCIIFDLMLYKCYCYYFQFSFLLFCSNVGAKKTTHIIFSFSYSAKFMGLIEKWDQQQFYVYFCAKKGKTKTWDFHLLPVLFLLLLFILLYWMDQIETINFYGETCWFRFV